MLWDQLIIVTNFSYAYYFRAFMLDEWKVHLYIIVTFIHNEEHVTYLKLRT